MTSLQKGIKLGGIVAVILLLTNCNGTNASKAPKIKHTVNVETFKGISLGCNATLSYSESEQTSIEVNTSRAIFDNMHFETVDDLLDISFKNNTNISYDEAIEISISGPSVDVFILTGSGSISANYNILNQKKQVSLEVIGSGDILAENLNTKSFFLKIAGSGNITSKGLSAGKVQASIDGSGDMTVDGTCNNSKIEIVGSGSFQGYDCETKNAIIEVTGSGDCEVTVLNELQAVIAGSGDIFYRGNPQISTNITGSGVVQNK